MTKGMPFRAWVCLIIIQACMLLFGGVNASLYNSSPRQSRRTSSAVDEATASASTPCTGVPSVQNNNRRACAFYIWDAPSALLYKWCHHLLKDHLYEGKGGHMFVRYESNSILQLLYPCSRYSPNRCLVCGGNYADHLELWWSSHLYTPFDLNLDKTYKDALSLDEGNEQKHGRRRNPKDPEVTGPPTYAFHKRYVRDVSHWIQEGNGIKDQWEQVKQKLARDRTDPNIKGWRLTRFPGYEVSYVIPQRKDEVRKRPSLILQFARALVQGNLDSLIVLQETENAKLKK